MDRKGVRCQVYDVVFHPDTLHLAQKNKAFRDMVNSTACEAVESNFEVTLDRKNLKFPKLQYKGFPQAAVIRKPSTEQPPELSPEDKELMEKLYAQSGGGEYPPKPENKSPKKSRKSPKKSKGEEESKSAYTTPKYVIKHRRHIELEEFTYHKNCKMNSAIPKELVVEVNLPLLKSSADIVLDVAEKTLQLVSEKPAKYKLVLTLPYRVNQDSGNAKFDKDQKKLVVTLPVKTNAGISLSDVARDDSGVDSDHGSMTSSSPVDEIDSNLSLITELNSEAVKEDELNKNVIENETSVQGTFLDTNLHYSLPEFTSNIFENTIAFTLNVKNVDEMSISKIVGEDDVHIKFSSLSSGFYPLHYAFYVKLPSHNIDSDKVSIEAWDNNVIVQINYKPCDTLISSYLFGVDGQGLSEKYFQEPSIINDVLQKLPEESSETVQKTRTPENQKQGSQEQAQTKPGEKLKEKLNEDFEENLEFKEKFMGALKKADSKCKNRKDKKKLKKQICDSAELVEEETTETEEEEDKIGGIEHYEHSYSKLSTAIDIFGAFSESSSDEISHSFSPTKSRGILKGFSNSRRFGRSISESGLDDVSWTSSVENCHASVDSVIPEEGEMSTSLKKTVRFNDVVSRQLFRSNSSILGQRKKNQRKAKAKKRAQERRHSEGELSETEDKKERDAETMEECENSGGNEKGNNEGTDGAEQKSYFANDIFELDMNF